MGLKTPFEISSMFCNEFFEKLKEFKVDIK